MVLRKIGEYVLLSINFIFNHLTTAFELVFKKKHRGSLSEIDETACTWVSSRGIAKSCNVHPALVISDEKAFHPEYYQGIKDGDSVYVISKSLGRFFEQVMPRLREEKISITLVTGASVRGVPNEVSQQHNLEYLKLIEQDNTIIKWYTQNYDLDKPHEKIAPIPLGLDYHTLFKKPFWWGPKMYPTDQEKQLQQIRQHSPPFELRHNKSYSFFHFNLFDRHGQDRQDAITALKGLDDHDFATRRMTRKKTWQICSQYKYIISPHGNGLDCHRTYEAIALGCIPVVRSSTLDSLYAGLPIIIFENWADCTIKNLNSKALELKSHALNKMTLTFWNNTLMS